MVAIMVAACARPASEEYFSLVGPDGYAHFSLDMMEDLDYSLQLYIYADAASCDSLSVQIDYLSPDERVFREDVVLTRADAASAFGNQAVFKRVLRENFYPVIHGLWKASVKVEEGVTGAGLRLYRNNTDGTR